MKRVQRSVTDNSVATNIITVVLFLICYGLVMICSASYTEGMSYMIRQLIFALAGAFAAYFVCQVMSWKFMYKCTNLLYFGSLGTVCLLLSPLGINVNGATRWLGVRSISFQPVELVKLAVIFMIARMIHKESDKLEKPSFILMCWFVGGLPAGLVLLISRDLSSAVVILAITFIMTLIFTNRPKMHLIMFGIAVVVAGVCILWVWTHMPDPNADIQFRIFRIAAWLDPKRYEKGVGYQTLQSVYAIGSGSLFGKGLGSSFQKMGTLPEAHTDFIFSILVEELGVFGAALLLLLFIYLFYLIYTVIIKSKRQRLFYSALGVGILAHIAVQNIFNIAVTLGILPNTGLPLLFISYGGTNLVFILCEIGVILKIEKGNL